MSRLVFVVVALSIVAPAAGGFSPARYRSGALPALSAVAVGGGEAFAELTVGVDGRVTAVRPLRSTPPFTSLVIEAARRWRFAPAEDDVAPERGGGSEGRRIAVESKVLVAAIYRPPALAGPTLGDRPQDVAAASADAPFPLATSTPPFPPSARSPGVVLVEARVDADGAVASASVIVPAPPFDGAALSAARQWRFRPARMGGRPVSTLVYLVFGFPAPVLGPPTVPRLP